MSIEHIECPQDLIVIGRALRTTPAAAPDDIPKLWQQFLQGEGASRRSVEPVYAVYCDYENDHRGGYTLVLGFLASDAGEPGAGQRRVTIPQGRMARFAAHGEPSRVIWQTWAHINERWARSHERRYIADFEKYMPSSTPDRVDAEICVGVR